MSILRVSVTMHPMALHHMVVSFGLMPTCFFVTVTAQTGCLS